MPYPNAVTPPRITPTEAASRSMVITPPEPRSTVIPTEAAPLAGHEMSARRGRAEGPLPEAERLIERSARLFLQSLLNRITTSEEALMYVYILSSPRGTLYTGVTNDICRRTREHVEKLNRGFSQKYGCIKLLYFEIHDSADSAIDREKQIKNWRREKKEFLIRTLNPPWIDLRPYLPAEETDLEY